VQHFGTTSLKVKIPSKRTLEYKEYFDQYQTNLSIWSHFAPCHLYEGHPIIHDHTPLDKGMPHANSVGLKIALFIGETRLEICDDVNTKLDVLS